MAMSITLNERFALEDAIRSEHCITDFIGALYFIKGWNPSITIAEALTIVEYLASQHVISID